MIVFAHDLTVPAGTTKAEPYTEEVKLTSGTLKEVSIGFPFGCRGTVHVNVLIGTLQIVPIIEGQSFAWDNVLKSFEVSFPLRETARPIVVRGWSPNARYDHTITFLFSVETEEEEMNVAETLRSLIG
jgi:hypothetical protein